MIRAVELIAALLSLAISANGADTRSADSSRPRGVGPEFAKFYKSPDTFACISAPSIKLPASAVNDNYCDCPDGSDEPGTAACAHLGPYSPTQPFHHAGAPGNTTLALPGFYCKNRNHNPSYIRFEYVNDGVCDYDLCCDGSDEWAGVGGITCPDKCTAIGKEWRRNEEIRLKAISRALKKRKELQTEADKLRRELEDKITAAKIRVQGLERKLTETEENLKDVERREKLRVVKSDASGKGRGKLGVLLNLSRDRVNELRTALLKTKNQRDDMVARVTELEALLSDLKEQYNPNFNDAGVKKAVSGWEDYAARESTDTWTEAEDRDLNEIIREDSAESGVNFSEFEHDEAPPSDAAAIYSLTSYLPPSLQSWLSTSLAGLRQILVDNGVLPDTTASADIQDSPAVKNARQTRDDTQRELSNVQNDLSRDTEDLDRDYGSGGIFRALKDQCVDVESGEYRYSHCFLSRTNQTPKKGGSQTNMGNFVGFDVEYVDDDDPTDGKGLGRGERIVLKYENGQTCWNGPARSTRVVLACAENNEIWKVGESEKCVYRMEAGTPAVCGWEGQEAGKGEDTETKPAAKDEL